MIVISSLPRIYIWRGLVPIRPGNNVVPEEKAKTMIRKKRNEEKVSLNMVDDPVFAAMVKKGQFIIRESADVDPENAGDSDGADASAEVQEVLAMTVANAKEFIEGCADVKLLREIAKASSKKGVVTAAEKQIKDLEEPPDEV